jgi:hypothetical protein
MADKSIPMNSDHAFQDQVTTTLDRLISYCEENEWAGHDPYDALNSKIFMALPFLDSRLPRLVLTQALKRSPINVRSLLQVPKTQNPKALALFLSAFVKLSKDQPGKNQDRIRFMVDRIRALRSQQTPYWCWGYSFPWQTRTIIVPRGTPNLVCTTFVANALVDLYEQGGGPECLTIAVSAAEYIFNELYWEEAGSATAGFGYPLKSLRSRIHNANLLAAALFSRIYKHTGEAKFVATALRAARYSAAQQHDDGSWYYGEDTTQQWIDNFHTGYNLIALQQIDDYLNTDEFRSRIDKGFAFYNSHFFDKHGTARYFHDCTYPIDIHCVAQSIITLAEFRHLDPSSVSLAQSVFRWAHEHMWDDNGFFYYRVLRSCTIRTSYMRWSQAWMLLALVTLLATSQAETKLNTQEKSTSVTLAATTTSA